MPLFEVECSPGGLQGAGVLSAPLKLIALSFRPIENEECDFLRMVGVALLGTSSESSVAEPMSMQPLQPLR